MSYCSSSTCNCCYTMDPCNQTCYCGNRYMTENGKLIYPSDDGFAEGTKYETTLEAGTEIDRYDQGTSGNGRFACPTGESFASRSLPGPVSKYTYSMYEVVKPVAVDAGIAASWFGKVGGAVQYKFATTLTKLVSQGVLRRL